MFQKKIVEKYLSKLDKDLLKQKYDLFCSIFKNDKKIENIRNSKEEQYQEGFIRDLFVAVLGYTIKPEENYNILTELKNEVANKSNSKKSDGAICEENNENKIRAVIELKGTDTTDLDKVAFQAFSYKNFHNECNYVIVSNFERLRLYVETQIEFEEFNLFNLSFERFCILYLLLELNQLKSDIPLKLKHETLSEEKAITDNFYADYSTFKRLLFEDLIENNPETDKLLLFKKTQKLLDRILFILFCEDRNLLPANSVAGIISDYQKLKELGYGQPLYNVFKTFFDRIDKGWKSENDSSKNIFAYNGGLFKTDEILDNIKVGDDVLYIHTKRLADYDFESQISVDILGRIFENSLTEIEEVQKEIEAEKAGAKVENNNVGKRKKDGVFYTPEYITKYIVENTIGKLCQEKRNELNITDEEFSSEKSVKSGDDKKTIADKQKVTEELDKRLEAYRAWLLDLKILDPACGSGAFLNAALQQLKIEHTLIDYYWSNIHAGELNFTEIENTILENNLYGVDINDESVEIAKLSLWLHTAKKNRKLTTLNGKIKCGNSLIDDPAVAGEKAFKWEEEFPEIFAKGGFDVVIGNPPYVPSKSISEKEKNYYYEYYRTAEYQINTYGLFIEKVFHLLKKDNRYGMIIPNYWLSTKNDSSLRKIVFCENQCTSILNTYNVFEDAVVDTLILIGERKLPSKETEILSVDRKLKSISERLHKISAKEWSFYQKKNFTENDEEIEISFSNTFDLNCERKLGDYFSLFQGMKPYEQGKGNPPQTKEMMKSRVYHSEKKIDESYFPLLGASNIQRYFLRPNSEFIKYGENLAAPRKIEIFSGERILANRILSKKYLDCTYVDFTAINNTDVFNLIPRDYCPIKTIYAILASLLCSFYLKSKNVNLDRNVFPKINVNTLENFPLPDLTDSQFSTINSQLTTLADRMLSLNETFQKKCGNFIKVVKQTFEMEKVSAKMESFYELDFDGFVKELKQKITPKLKLEWLEVFEDTKKELLDLKQQIDSTDKEINQLVYQLYGLTEEEIAVVEGK